MNKNFILLPQDKQIVKLDLYDKFILKDNSIFGYRDEELVELIHDDDVAIVEGIFQDIAENICVNGYSARKIQ